MFWTMTCRVIAAVVAFLIGWAAFVIVRPAQDLRSLKTGERQISAITLKRQGCSNAELKCPVYDVTFRSDGTATYIGYANDDFIGTFTTAYPQRNFAFLAEELQRERFFDLPQFYAGGPVEETMVLEVSTNEGSRVLTTTNWNNTPVELRTLHALVDYQTFIVVWDEVK
jgi:hypothetical protein